MPPAKISHDQIVDAVRRSGYLLEYRIEKVLGRNGYMAEANEVYPDPITAKSRELDITAIRPEPITRDFRNTIWPRLLIECINNPQPIAFFTKEANAPSAHIYDLKFSGLPVKIKKEKVWAKISDFLDMEKYHHHCKGRIATQYCSFTAKKGSNPTEWLAQHDETHFDSFNKLCFALNHEIDEHYSNSHLGANETINLQLYYPILVVAGEIINVTAARKELTVRSASQIHYIQSYISKGRVQRYHIDVVTEKHFPRLLGIIDREIKKTVALIRRRKAAFQTSIDEIVASTRRLRSVDAIRARMEYRGPWGRHDPY